MGDRHSTHNPRRGHEDPAAPPADLTTGAPELRAQIAALAEQVRALAARSGAASAPDAMTADRLSAGEDPISLAERAAEEIRARAYREAASILGRGEHTGAGVDDLARPAASPELETSVRGALTRQRRVLAVLTAESERLEQSVAILSAQVRALDCELGELHRLLAATASPLNPATPRRD